MVSPHFCLFNSARFAQFTTNGFHPQWGTLEKNEHLEPIFGKVIILSGLSR